MGGAYTALADDVNALYYNPAGLALIGRQSGETSRAEFGFTHTQWLLDSKFDFAGFAQQTRLGTFGLGLIRLGTGNQEARDENRQVLGEYSASDSVYTLGYGKTFEGIGPKGALGLGANLKYLESRIGSDSASTVALDVGAVRRFERVPLSFGLSVLNIGRGMKFIDQRDPLPLAMSVGAAYSLGGLVNLALDVRHEPYDRRTDVGVGTEYAVLPMFMLRAGYASQAARAAQGGPAPLSGLAGGFGLRIGNYRADYTFTPFGYLGNVQRISLGARF
jgi:hypothetical protein